MSHWFDATPIAGFDLETTGPDPTTARPVVAALTRHRGAAHHPAPGFPLRINPGVPVATEAAAVNGITTAQAAAHPTGLADGMEALNAALLDACAEGAVLVGANIRYDLTVAEFNSRRCGVVPLHARAAAADVGVFVADVLLLDRWWDRYRAGPRNLAAVAANYGVALESPHEATADALAAVGVARRIMARAADPEAAGAPRRMTAGWWEVRRWVELRACRTPAELHALQVRWQAEFSAAHEAYKRIQDPGYEEPAGWPVAAGPVGA